MRYKIYRDGPGDGSTYAECWGAQATSMGRLIAETNDLSEAQRRREIEADGDSDGGVSVMIRDSVEHTWIE